MKILLQNKIIRGFFKKMLIEKKRADNIKYQQKFWKTNILMRMP